MKAQPKLRQILVPTADLDEAIDFYEATLGLPVKFRDGDRFAAIDCGEVTLALVTAEDMQLGRGIAPALKVESLEDIEAQLRDAGARVGSPQVGAHEQRLEALDPSGNPIVLYAPFNP